MLKLIGGLLVAWGVLDFVLSWMDTDLYAEIGITIPDAIWAYTAYIVGGIGFALFAAGQKQGEDDTEDDEGVIESHDQSEVPLTPTENGIFNIKTRCEFSLESIQYILNEFIGDEGINSEHFIYEISESENIYVQGMWVGDADIIGKLKLELVGKSFLTNPEKLDNVKLEKIISCGWNSNSGVEENFICEMKTQDCMGNHLAPGEYNLGAKIIFDSLKVFDLQEHQIIPTYIIE